MCLPMLAPLLGTAAAGTAATGAAASAVTIGSVLQTVGTIAGIGGSLLQGAQARGAAKQQEAYLAAQAKTEGQLNATEDQRRRREFGSAMRQQIAELAARGVALDSPTAVLLGQSAAQEMSFESQAVRSGGQARQAELTAEQRMVRAQGSAAALRGKFSAVSTLLNAAPDLWPGFTERKFGRQLA